MIAALAIAAAAALAPTCAALVTTSDINRCEFQRFAKADSSLNHQWKISLAKMRKRDQGYQDPRSVPPSYTDAFIAAQRAWLGYRDSNCLVTGYRVRGGTAQPAREIACKTALTLARIQELRDQTKGY